MSYQVLARKWRPKNFSEMAGQTHVLQTLTHALEQQRLHHAYLFTGTRGVGKTTVARILARCLNCETGITATPCGTCDACREISEGRFIDLIEVDAASRTRVEDTRELLENVQYAPSRGRYKVYLIDEVHMLSTHSFNALLKTLEEPPPHVKFLLATTDPQKLPVTVLSRCLQFHLKNLAPRQIVSYLESVLTAEQIEYEEDALWQLARAAAGSMRDALTLLDQSISFGEGRVHTGAVTDLLGTPDHGLIFALLEALAGRDGAAITTLVANAAENNPDFERLLSHFTSVLHRLAVAQTLPDAVDNSEGDKEQITSLAGKLSGEDVQLYYQFAMQAMQEMHFSPDRRISFEMAMLRMLAFSPDVFSRAQADLVPEGEKKKPELTISETSPSDNDAVSEPATRHDVPPQIEQAPADDDAMNQIPVQSVAPAPDFPAETPEPALDMAAEADVSVGEGPAPVNPEGGSQPGKIESSDWDWYDLVQRSGLAGISGNILWNCVLSDRQNDQLSLTLDQQQSALYSTDHAEHIAHALSDSLGYPVTVNISIGELNQESPAQRRAREKQEAIAALHQRFHNDPGVKALVQTFDASIEQLRTEYERF
ncbi:DNA polymerase III subunit gamma/tau [Pseudohongiella sp. SYSU M77423]|uniref:DNA polymerase III subunit gamma/tau n=1 Tax=unclassified Pseudohongiella TaxID=2629611 RepID=UPI001EFFAD70|nr:MULTISPECIES: DNA polymerase III subunit gamma/tau [unclassified Pseudohongiella]MDH7943183.1 DNA polymerase III subunit gamma/tau [Pseudohongiella sp. SYSU M77423]MEC8860089.1 DNA polymerase III subunit gamma/tau [Pseudomonadota bacterium]